MTAIAPVPHQKTPSPWSPTPRDEAIYRAVRIAGRTQADVAGQNGLHQTTVSRILQKFEQWRGAAEPTSSGGLTPLAQQRLDGWLARERHEEIFARAMRLAERMEQPALVTRKGEWGDKSFSEETRRDQQSAAARFLHTAQRSTDALNRLAENSPLSDEKLTEGMIKSGVLRLREEAEEAGQICRDDYPYATNDRLFKVLLGRDPYGITKERLTPGTPLGDLILALVSHCVNASPEEVLRRLADVTAVASEEAAAEPDNDCPPDADDPLPDDEPASDESLISDPSSSPTTHLSPAATPPTHKTHKCITPNRPAIDQERQPPLHRTPCRTGTNAPQPGDGKVIRLMG